MKQTLILKMFLILAKYKVLVFTALVKTYLHLGLFSICMYHCCTYCTQLVTVSFKTDCNTKCCQLVIHI